MINLFLFILIFLVSAYIQYYILQVLLGMRDRNMFKCIWMKIKLFYYEVFGKCDDELYNEIFNRNKK